MSSSIRRLASGFLTWAVIAGSPALAVTDDAFVQVQPRDLVANPQKYWAQGIVFKDTLVAAPKGASRKMGERRVVSFQTKVAGTCYADEAIVPALHDMKPGAECLLSGTVFQESGWFSSHFFVVIQQVTVTADRLTELPAKLERLQAMDSNAVYAATARRLEQLLNQIQSDLLAYSSAQKASMPELFDPASPHREALQQTIRGGLAKMEEQTREPSAVFLGNLVAAMLAQRYVMAPAGSNAAPVQTSPPGKPNVETNPEASKTVSAAAPVQPAAPLVEYVQPKPVQPELVRQVEEKTTKVPDLKPAQAVAPPAKPAKKAVAVAPVTKPDVDPVAKAEAMQKAAVPAPSFFERLFGGGEKQKKKAPDTTLQPAAKVDAKPASKPVSVPVQPVPAATNAAIPQAAIPAAPVAGRPALAADQPAPAR